MLQARTADESGAVS